MARITVNLSRSADDYISEFGSGAKLYLDSASSESGSYSNATSTALVSGTEQYEINDPAGTSSTWYKARVGNSAGSTYGSYGDAFQATSWGAYATVQDVHEAMDLPGSTLGAKHNLIADLLLRGKAAIDERTHRTFLRVPQVSGTVTSYCDITNPGQRSLVRAIGMPYTTDGRAIDIVSVSNVYVRTSRTADYVEVTSSYYDLRTAMPGIGGTTVPWEDMWLSEDGTYTTWPTGIAAAKFVWALGWPAIPEHMRQVNLDWAINRYDRMRGNANVPAGVNRFGTPILATDDPPSFVALRHSVFRKTGWVV